MWVFVFFPPFLLRLCLAHSLFFFFFVNLFIRVQRAVNISADVGRDLKRKEEEKYNIINKRTVTTIKTKVNWRRS